jgi:dTDP-4-amino-4,6-dideoxygalactose transaminase
MVDLKIQYEAMKEEMDAAVLSVIRSTSFILGSEGRKLEQSIDAYHGV